MNNWQKITLGIVVTSSIFGVVEYAKAQYTGSCNDVWVTNAIKEEYGRNPRGVGRRGECNILLYGNGRWSSYNDLKNKVRAARYRYDDGECRDPWIRSAFRQKLLRDPNGYGEVGECDMYRYNNGSWGSFDELMYYIH